MNSAKPRVWLDYDQDELDDQYNQRILVPDANDYMARNLVESERVRGVLECRLDVPYGPSADERVDIFPAKTDGAPMVVFYHGGAWTRWHKDHNSFQAPAFTCAGATFVSVNFSLLPGVSMDEQMRQCRAAVVWAHRNARDIGADPDRLFVAGHSSGAHIAGLLAVTDWAGDWGLPADVVKGAVAASGMYELEPVRLSSRNEYVRLDLEATARHSAIRRIPDRMPPMVIAYGELEQKEFRRHSIDFARALRERGHACVELDLPGLNHFDVAQQFADPDGKLLVAAFGMMGLRPSDSKA